jgi:hypothetical protein
MNTFEGILVTAVAGVTLLAAPVRSHGVTGGPQPAALPAGVPRQYAVLAEQGTSLPASSRTNLVIRDTATGRTMATVLAPRPANSFCDLSGTPDGRLFVAETCTVSGELGVTRQVGFALLSVDGQGHVGRLRPLRIPVPGGSIVDGSAVSPGGRTLAVASPGRGNVTRNPAIRLYDLGSGRLLRKWRWAGQAFLLGRNPVCSIDPLSWTADGRTIAFALQTGLMEKAQVRLLDTAAPGSDLHRTRRVVNFGRGPHEKDFFIGELNDPDSRITPDGSRIVASTVAVCCHGLDAKTLMTVSEFSVATGARVALLHSVPVPQLAVIFLPVLWSSPDGSTVIAAAAPPTGETMPVDIMSGRGITPLLGSMAGISQLAF